MSNNYYTIHSTHYYCYIRYFTSAQVSPIQRGLYKVNIDGSGFSPLTGAPGYYSASFNPAGTYYLLTKSGPEVPYQILRPADPNGTFPRWSILY